MPDQDAELLRIIPEWLAPGAQRPRPTRGVRGRQPASPDDTPLAPALILAGAPIDGVRSILSRDKHRGALEAAGPQISQRLVSLFQGISGRLGDYAHLGNQAQKIDAVLPCEIGDRHELPLLP
jgi:hypothetical protein